MHKGLSEGASFSVLAAFAINIRIAVLVWRRFAITEVHHRIAENKNNVYVLDEIHRDSCREDRKNRRQKVSLVTVSSYSCSHILLQIVN